MTVRRWVLAFVLLVIGTACASAQNVGMIGTTVPAPTVATPIPGAPANLSPACGATGVSVNPTITFTVVGASTYSLKLNIFSAPTTVYALGATASYTPSSPLANGQIYYWIPKGINSSGEHEASSICSFTTTEVDIPPGPTSSTNCTDPADNSPTGVNPILGWTCEQQHAWNLMFADYTANPSAPATLGGQVFKVWKAESDAGGGNDRANVDALLYQITGNTTYATRALAELEVDFFPLWNQYGGPPSLGVPSTQFGHPGGTVYPILFNFLWPSLSATNRTRYETLWMGILDTPSNREPFGNRLFDTDETINEYAAVVLFHLAVPSNATGTMLFNKAIVGGLDTTNCNANNTMRNWICKIYTELAEGGEGSDSSEYNSDTMASGVMLAHAVFTATGINHFPEIDTWVAQAVSRDHYFRTPDLASEWLWGDDQGVNRKDAGGFVWNTQILNTTVTGYAQLHGIASGIGQDLIIKVMTKFGGIPPTSFLYNTALPRPFGSFMWNPYGTRGDDTTLSPGKYFAGHGHVMFRDGNGVNDTLFGMQSVFNKTTTNYVPVDHTGGAIGTFQLYRQGAWALTYGYSYGGPSTFAASGTNSAGFYNSLYSYAEEFNKVTAHETGSNYAYMAATTGGSTYGAGTGGTYPTWLHENTRALLYLSSSDKASDVVIVHDRFYAKQPQNQCIITNPSYCFASVYTSDQQTILNAQPRREVTFHTYNSPTDSAGGMHWTTQGGDTAFIKQLLPSSGTVRTVYDEINNQLPTWASNGQILFTTNYDAVYTAERRYQFRETESSPADFQTYLNCVLIHDGITISCDLVQSVDLGTHGVLLKRAGLNDVLVVQNDRRGQMLAQPYLSSGVYRFPAGNATQLTCVRLMQAAYTIGWTSASATTDTFLTDLDPAASWAYSLDGGGSTALTVSTAGIARPSFSGAGAHSIVVTPTGAPGCTGGYGTETVGQTSLARANTALFAESAYPSSVTSKTVAYTVAAGSNRLMTLSVEENYGGVAPLISGCTYNGVAMTLMGSVVSSVGRWVNGLQLIAPATGTHDVVCTFGTAPDYIGIIIGTYTGADQTTQATSAEVTTIGGYGTPATLKQLAIPMRTNSWTVLAGSTFTGTVTAGAGTSVVLNDPAQGTVLLDSGGPIAASGDMYAMNATGVNGWGGVMWPIYPLLAP